MNRQQRRPIISTFQKAQSAVKLFKYIRVRLHSSIFFLQQQELSEFNDENWVELGQRDVFCDEPIGQLLTGIPSYQLGSIL